MLAQWQWLNYSISQLKYSFKLRNVLEFAYHAHQSDQASQSLASDLKYQVRM